MTPLALALLLLAADPADFTTPLPATDHQSYALNTVSARAPATVIEFFSPTCPCQAAHDARLLALAQKYAAQGVKFVLVDSNYGASVDADAAEAQRRGYPFPIVADPKGLWLQALGAKYATYALILDPAGKVRYRGGFDSESHPVTDHAKPYLDQAIAAVLAGSNPDPAETRALGCSLKRW